MVCFDISSYYPVHQHQTLNDFTGGIDKNGLHQVNGIGNPWHIYVKDCFQHDDCILVGFSGRVTLDGSMRPPYFSFRGVAEKTGLGLIAFADPSHNFHPDLSLCWYLGNRVDGNIIQKIADILDEVIELSGKRLLLAGGSGGGFAALNVHAQMKNRSRVRSFAWNPQTDITKYNNSVLRQYFRECFDAGISEVSGIVAFLKSEGYPYLLEKRKDLEQIILINGYDPAHLRNHVRRFFPEDDDDKNGIFVGDWGIGHVPPGADVIVDVIKGMASGLSVPEILSNLIPPKKPALKLSLHKDLLDEVLQFRVAVLVGKGRRTAVIRSNLYEHFCGFQVRIKLKLRGTIAFDSGYLLGQDMSEVYVDLGNGGLADVNQSIISYMIEDLEGRRTFYDFPFLKFRKILNVKNLA
ncbi:hypothetical protein [Brachymonas chironomi]|uniref:hypothetical protein n=1 Tax=Brachymonas chironomi TaxID=491919 RepID=UPI0003A3B9E4|nr:hypothetical protein [Brachymonas chironomi]